MAARSAQRPNPTIAQTGLPRTLVSLWSLNLSLVPSERAWQSLCRHGTAMAIHLEHTEHPRAHSSVPLPWVCQPIFPFTVKRPKSNHSSARASTTQPENILTPHLNCRDPGQEESVRKYQPTHLYHPPHNHQASAVNSSFETPQSSYLPRATGSPEKGPAPTVPSSPTEAPRLRNRASSLACLCSSEPTQELQADLPVLVSAQPHSKDLSPRTLNSELPLPVTHCLIGRIQVPMDTVYAAPPGPFTVKSMRWE